MVKVVGGAEDDRLLGGQMSGPRVTDLIAEATISFLGLGIHPPTPSWGNMLTEAQRYLIQSPFLSVFPGLPLLITVVSVILLGHALRAAPEPRPKR